MKTRLIITAALIAATAVGLQAAVVNHGASLVIATATNAVVDGDFINASDGSSHGEATVNGTLRIAGDLDNQASSGQTFAATSAGTVVLTGSGQAVSGDNSFPALTKTVTAADTLTFESGSTTTVTGTATLSGAAGQLLSLRGSTPGSQWDFDPQGTRNFELLDVQDSNNTNATAIDVASDNCVDSGNNTNWVFGGGTSYVVSFTAGANGTIIGASPQTVVSGADCSEVRAEADPGHHFVNWTDALGAVYSTINPLTVKNVTSDLDLTANFEANPVGTYEVRFTAGANGSLSGDTAQFIADGADCAPVQAVPDAGFHFDGWTGDHVGNENPLTITGVSADMNITANFAANAAGDYTVNFIAGANGSITGDISQVIASGGNCAAVTAVPDSGYEFTAWFGDYSGTDNPLTITNVTADMEIEARFDAIENAVTIGKIVELLPADITGYTIAEFASKPSVTAFYTDPVKLKEAKTKMKTANKISKKAPTTAADLEWKKPVALIDKKQWLKTETCEDTIDRLCGPAGEITPVTCDLEAKVNYTDASGDKQKLKDADCGEVVITPPSITRVLDSVGAVTVSAAANETITIQGVYFGVKAPKVWLEYPKTNGKGDTQIKALKLKVVKPLAYPDYKGKAGKSCMDVETGDSEITVFMPKKWKKDWDHSADHNIVIDNKIGRATTDFGTSP